jgi:YrbI family 3-deoxy-D-manno-octulosonate 8-phosphate phosphatase
MDSEKILSEKVKKIRLVLTDVDGVLTDAGVYYGAEGEVLKRFSIRDGMGVERLMKLCRIETGIITGEISPSVSKRAEKIQVKELHLGIKDKMSTLNKISSAKQISLEEIAYIGDDVNDLEVLQSVGLAACPADAMDEIKKTADFISSQKGGHGCFRDVAELIIQHQTK